MEGCSSAPQVWGCLVPEVPIGDPKSAGQPGQVSVWRMAIIPGLEDGDYPGNPRHLPGPPAAALG